jgi:hypothetical protein
MVKTNQKASKPRSTRRLAENGTIQDTGNVIVVHPDPIGSSGSRNYSGYPSEEYLSTLRGYQAADIYDKMRRSESQIKMALAAVKNPIKKAVWDIEAVDDSAEEQEIKEFCEHILFCDMDKGWSDFLQEALSMVDFGFAPFEITDKVVLDHPKFGSYNGIRSLGWRSPRTIYRFNLDKKTGELVSLSQYAFGDLQRLVDIPAEHLMLLSLDKEGDNYEGISGLRACYGAFTRKQMYLKLQAIGLEKYAVPTPVGKIPEGKQNSEQVALFKQALEIYSSHQANYIITPAGDWAIDFNNTNFDPAKVQTAIESEDRNIVKSFIANFLELGQSSSSGSWALSFDQSDFFLTGIEHIADMICEAVQRRVIERVVKLNYGPREEYPELAYSGISDEAGKELAETLKYLVDGKVITPDDDLEDNIRQRYKLPKRSEKGQRKVTPPPPAPGLPDPNSGNGSVDNPPAGGKPAKPDATNLAELRIKLAEKRARKQITEAKGALLPIMQDNLHLSGQGLVAAIMKRWKALPDKSKANATKDLSASGGAAFKAALLDSMTQAAGVALKAARAEVPKARKVQLTDQIDSIRLDEPISLDELPKAIQALLKNKAQLLSDTQLADLEKAIFFRFSSSVSSTDSPSILESDLNDAVESMVESAVLETAAANASATVVNESRNAFFFDDDVLEEIESFTFVNGDPVSPICQDLAGTTFAKDDPEAARYFPPLHHNCKSYIVANPVGGNRNPKISDTGLKPSTPELDKYVTL